MVGQSILIICTQFTRTFKRTAPVKTLCPLLLHCFILQLIWHLPCECIPCVEFKQNYNVKGLKYYVSKPLYITLNVLHLSLIVLLCTGSKSLMATYTLKIILVNNKIVNYSPSPLPCFLHTSSNFIHQDNTAHRLCYQTIYLSLRATTQAALYPNNAIQFMQIIYSCWTIQAVTLATNCHIVSLTKTERTSPSYFSMVKYYVLYTFASQTQNGR
jgi:hypothetical protein